MNKVFISYVFDVEYMARQLKQAQRIDGPRAPNQALKTLLFATTCALFFVVDFNNTLLLGMAVFYWLGALFVMTMPFSTDWLKFRWKKWRKAAFLGARVQVKFSDEGGELVTTNKPRPGADELTSSVKFPWSSVKTVRFVEGWFRLEFNFMKDPMWLGRAYFVGDEELAEFVGLLRSTLDDSALFGVEDAIQDHGSVLEERI